jgi:hypothetical protein
MRVLLLNRSFHGWAKSRRNPEAVRGQDVPKGVRLKVEVYLKISWMFAHPILKPMKATSVFFHQTTVFQSRPVCIPAQQRPRC